MKLYVKSIQMMIPRNGGGGVESIKKSRASERCKNKIQWDVNASLIERERGQDKWSELIKWDEMSQPLRHVGVDFISPPPLYEVVFYYPASGDSGDGVDIQQLKWKKEEKMKKIDLF